MPLKDLLFACDGGAYIKSNRPLLAGREKIMKNYHHGLSGLVMTCGHFFDDWMEEAVFPL